MLKIDQSFVRGAAHTDPDALILEAIIQMAHGLKLDVVAEGVETLEEMDSLSKRGCTLMQGYLFSKPIPMQDFERSVTAPDAAWRLPIIRPEAWMPPEFDDAIDAPSASLDDEEDMLPALRDHPEEEG